MFSKIFTSLLIALTTVSLSIDAQAQDRKASRGNGGKQPAAAPNRGGGNNKGGHVDRSNRQPAPVVRTPDRNTNRNSGNVDRKPSRTNPVVTNPGRVDRKPNRVPTPVVTNPGRVDRKPNRVPTPVVTNPGRVDRKPNRVPTPVVTNPGRVDRKPNRVPTPVVTNPGRVDRKPNRTPAPVVTNPGHVDRKPGNVNNGRNNNNGNHVNRSPRRNYQQREFVRGNTRFVERRRFDNHRNREVVNNYRQHNWGRHNLNIYVHHNHRPNFWGNVYIRFPVARSYYWNWNRYAWYNTWGYYYSPYTVYYAPSYWITDYVISDMLREQYSSGYSDGYNQGFADGVSISNQQRDQIRNQIEQTSQAFNSDNYLSVMEAFRNPDYLFVVDTQLSVLDSNNTTCALSGGDLLKVYGQVNEYSPAARMIVVTSKAGSCEAGTVVDVSIDDLQEMLNTFSEKIEEGTTQYESIGPTT